jgi:hypothetical protein
MPRMSSASFSSFAPATLRSAQLRAICVDLPASAAALARACASTWRSLARARRGRGWHERV